MLAGGFGSAVCELLSQRQAKASITCLGLPDSFVEHGETSLLLKKYGLDVDGVVERIRGSGGLCLECGSLLAAALYRR